MSAVRAIAGVLVGAELGAEICEPRADSRSISEIVPPSGLSSIVILDAMGLGFPSPDG